MICRNDGTWNRSFKGDPDYALCPAVCNPANRPSNVENIACPAPFQLETKGVHNYLVMCQADGTWSRQISGAADYSACPKSCDNSTKPPASQNVACPAPFASAISGIQNSTITCLSNGTWNSTPNGNADYRNCPQSCDPSLKPASQEPAICPSSGIRMAFQYYNVSCQSNGTWLRSPTALDTTACPAATCNPATKPADSQKVGCPTPNEFSINSVQNYAVSCSGTMWVSVPTTRNDSSCPKNCIATKPSDGSDTVSCASPYQSEKLAIQPFIYTCDSSTGLYGKQNVGPVDYSNCPKSCTGPAPSDRQATSCPAGYTGTAYRMMNVSCNTATGNWMRTANGMIDNTGCSPATCTDIKPPAMESRACPAPFADRNDAKQFYSVTCEMGSWISQAIGGVDTSSCPVNDCTGSLNPGTQKIVGTCGAGASGHVTQTCEVTCSGRTFSQINCTANDYSQCDCGPNATYNTSSRSCIPNAVRCTPSVANEAPMACGAGYNGGTKYRTITTSCPQGPYGEPSVSYSDYNRSSCVSCPGQRTRNENPVCYGGKSPVTGSKVTQVNYSCASGTAVPTGETLVSAGSCVSCKIELTSYYFTQEYCLSANDGEINNPPPYCGGYAQNGVAASGKLCDTNNQVYYNYTYTCVCK